MSEPDLGSLRLLYEHKVQERNRLRDARRAYTAQLGPMPAAAAIVIGLFSGLSKDVSGGLLLGALIPLVLMVVISFFGITRPSFREISKGPPPTTLPEKEWLQQAVRDEDEVDPEAVKGLRFERWCVYLVQALLLVEVVYLVVVAAR